MAKKVDINGFWLIEKNPITKEGIFPYSGSQIDFSGSLGLEPAKLYNVLRPAEELEKEEAVQSFNGIPFIDEHEMIGDGCTSYDDRPAGGVLYNVESKSGAMLGDFKIFSEGLRDSIQNGKKELSLGYRCRYEQKRGVHNGEAYDFVQRDIVGNHVALVERGRMGSSVRVYDSKAMVFDSIEEIKHMKKTPLIERLLAAMDSDEFTEPEKKLVLDACDPDNEEKKEDVAEDMAEESEKKEEKAEDAEEESDKPDDSEKAEDEDEPAKEKKDDEKKDAMDSFPAFAAEIAKRDALAGQLTPLIGAFDHAPMTAAKVAEYACKKLKISAAQGEELATVQGFLLGKSIAKQSVAMDSAKETGTDAAFAKYLKEGDK